VEETRHSITTRSVRVRTYVSVLAVISPILLGLGLIYLFAAGSIGIATVLAGSFALVALAVTGVVFHAGADEADADGATPSRMRL
jgi:hypothetical protein